MLVQDLSSVVDTRAVLIIGSADWYRLILPNFMVINIGSNQHTFRYDYQY